MMCVVYVSVKRVHSGYWCFGVDLCAYDLRKDELFVLSWARVRRLSISLELPMYGRRVQVF